MSYAFAEAAPATVYTEQTIRRLARCKIIADFAGKNPATGSADFPFGFAYKNAYLWGGRYIP